MCGPCTIEYFISWFLAALIYTRPTAADMTHLFSLCTLILINLIRVTYAVRRLCSDFMDMLRRLISRIIIIIIIIIIIPGRCYDRGVVLPWLISVFLVYLWNCLCTEVDICRRKFQKNVTFGFSFRDEFLVNFHVLFCRANPLVLMRTKYTTTTRVTLRVIPVHLTPWTDPFYADLTHFFVFVDQSWQYFADLMHLMIWKLFIRVFRTNGLNVGLLLPTVQSGP